MLGRDLIMYILKNRLEDVDVFDEEFFKRFPTVDTIAIKYNVGNATVKIWIEEGYLQGFEFGGQTYIVPSSLDEFTKKHCVID